ncbi:hypothetical protein Salat_1295500 [Sesamum alatum]|uniref:Uncharacterized protein n=1 Tax=Sesamum alatum TaxID=300844 RepID=A0AAE2CPQ3_9LAMI|nr:hypothetical protein Salat_1295500 [Sesamum alatum]
MAPGRRGGRGRGRGRGRRGRGRGSGRGGAAEETHQDSCHLSDNSTNPKSSQHQDCRVSTASPRYPTRRSRAFLAQCATLSLRHPVRSLLIPSQCNSVAPAPGILNETNDGSVSSNGDDSITSQQSPQHPVVSDLAAISSPDEGTLRNRYEIDDLKLIRKDNSAPNVDKSVSAGFTDHSVPVSKHWLDLGNLNSNLSSQCQGPQDVLDAYRHVSENCRLSHDDERPEKSTTDYVPRKRQCLSRSHSINLTEFARKLQEDLDDDPEEVESAIDPAFECVNGHRVKIEIAPLIRVIFEKYGDITSESDVGSASILAFFLEHLCDIYKRLEQTTIFDITNIELNDMLDQVRLFEREKLNVGWLRERLEYISQTKISFQEYLRFKEDEAKHDASIGSLEKELVDYRRELSDLHQKISLVEQKISAAEEDLVAKRAKADQTKKVASDIKARVKTLWKQTLEHQMMILFDAATQSDMTNNSNRKMYATIHGLDEVAAFLLAINRQVARRRLYLLWEADSTSVFSYPTGTGTQQQIQPSISHFIVTAHILHPGSQSNWSTAAPPNGVSPIRKFLGEI